MMNSILNPKNKKLIPILFWVLVWFIASLLVNSEVYLPSPLNVLRTLIDLLGTKSFYLSLLYTSFRCIFAFLLSLFLGVLFAFICYFFDTVYLLMEPLISMFRSLPVISVIFLINIYLNVELVPTVVSFLLSFPLIWTTVINGLKHTDSTLIDMAKIYKFSMVKKIFFIYIPSVFPGLFASMVSSLGLTWKVIATTEALTHPTYAIGKYLVLSKSNIDISALFAWTLSLLLLSIVFEHLLKLAFRDILKRRYGM